MQRFLKVSKDLSQNNSITGKCQVILKSTMKVKSAANTERDGFIWHVPDCCNNSTRMELSSYVLLNDENLRAA